MHETYGAYNIIFFRSDQLEVQYKLDHCKRALTDVDARGKITRARDFPKGVYVS